MNPDAMDLTSTELETPYAIFDDTHAPVYVVQFTGAKATEENFPAYLDALAALYASRDYLSIVFDANKASFPGLKYQRMQGDWIKTHDTLIREHCVGTAYVIGNPLIRTALKGIFAFQKQPVPFQVTKQLDKGIAWARVMLIERLP